jgi:MtN3 and saliva related transmembrane protein
MELADAIGWTASVVLLTTIGRQVYTQWKSGKSAGVSKWLFIGQMAASTGFIIYSLMLRNWVFVVTNIFMLATACIGQFLYLRSKANSPASSADAPSTNH